MNPFQVVMIISVTALCGVVALFLVLRKMPRINRGIGWWMFACLTLAFSYLLALIFYGQKQTIEGEVIFYALNMFSVTFAYIGNIKFLQLATGLKRYLFFFAVTLSMIAYIRVLEKQEFLADIVFVSYNAAFLFHSAWLFFSQRGEFRFLTFPIAGLNLITGMHFLNYPWLHDVEWFAPIGFLLAIMLGVSTYVLLAAMVLWQFRSRMITSENKAVYIAEHDQLTGLRNRFSLERDFSKQVQQADENSHSLALMYLDLDGFKAVNDTYGHKAGDKVLQVISERLEAKLNGVGYIARIGGDEFVVLCNQLYQYDQVQAEKIVSEILMVIEQPIEHRDNIYCVSSSIGISMYPKNGNTLEELLSAADAVMYKVKRAGANGFSFVDQALPSQNKNQYSKELSPVAAL